MRTTILSLRHIMPIIAVVGAYGILFAPQAHAESPISSLWRTLTGSNTQEQSPSPASSQTAPAADSTTPQAAASTQSPASTQQTQLPVQAATPNADTNSAIQASAPTTAASTSQISIDTSTLSSNTPTSSTATPSVYTAKNTSIIENPRVRNAGIVAAIGSIVIGSLALVAARTYRPAITRRPVPAILTQQQLH